MEHILQFAVSIDDETIKRNVEESAVNQVASELAKQVLTKRAYSTTVLNDVGRELIVAAFATYKEQIIAEAAKLLADSVKRSKAFKDAKDKMLEE